MGLINVFNCISLHLKMKLIFWNGWNHKIFSSYVNQS